MYAKGYERGALFLCSIDKYIYKTEDNEEVNEEKRELFNMVYSGFDKVKFCPAEKDGVVVYENLKNWIEKFRELLINQKQERLFGSLLGRLLAYSPDGKDGYAPCEIGRASCRERV